MCWVDDCDDWTLFAEASPVARKPHKCGECGRTIEPGERYRREGGLYDATSWQTHKTCAQCIEARRWLLVECSGWVFNAVNAELADHWCDERVFRCLGLGRMIVAGRRGWKRRDGTLYPPETVRGWCDAALAWAKAPERAP